jgi:hypothetical protein
VAYAGKKVGISKAFRRMSSALGLQAMVVKQLSVKREIKTFEQNVAVIRAAVLVMFPPRRRKMIMVMKDFLEHSEMAGLTRCLPTAHFFS